jgi:hypothetical protein
MCTSGGAQKTPTNAHKFAYIWLFPCLFIYLCLALDFAYKRAFFLFIKGLYKYKIYYNME